MQYLQAEVMRISDNLLCLLGRGFHFHIENNDWGIALVK